MANISISRALVKQKTLLSKVERLAERIRTSGALTTKDLSILSNEKDLDKNHQEAREAVKAMTQSIKDCMEYYAAITMAVNDSNLHATINTPIGTMSVAHALLMCQKLREPLVTYSAAISSLASSAESKAQRANRDLLNSNISNSMTKELLDAIEAKPLVLVDTAEVDKTKDMVAFVTNELNLLINEHNAMTIINVPDGLENII